MKYQAWNVATSDPAGWAALEQAGVSPLLAAVLSARGVDTAEQARQLLFPPPRQLSDPLLGTWTRPSSGCAWLWSEAKR